MGNPTSAPKIIASPEAQRAQIERVNAALMEREKSVMEKIQAVLKEENCMLNPMIQLNAMGVANCGYSIIANERLQQP